ncbi:serine/threonine-protein kinase [[Phormidium] sp. ETS-05]|uniref:serine/threonine protein kinase n=1 Tax=[Phormidium] sp. ETS-05 TaxID=222819 RepID=UPI0018EF0FA0|nr:serine/threonine-protein kinase [[Phormidium] sp. ETS-05]
MEENTIATQGYQIIRELGHNRAGGRVTYLATNHSPPSDTGNDELVVIKEFQFASGSNSTWEIYEEYQREIQVLQGLNHPGIPRYIESFQTDAGFCLVQEYKEAPPLSLTGSIWKPEQIKQIALDILEILSYLQHRLPPVIHRDIKPENILVSQHQNLGAEIVTATDKKQIDVYLVDFGFARIGQDPVAISSMVKGTMGFMPPEQIFNRELTTASDLYGVGATLICLLTGTKSQDIGNLIDQNYRIHFQSLLRKVSREFSRWLEKMVEPKPQDRFADADAALAALKPLSVVSVPKLRFSTKTVQLEPANLEGIATATITVQNTNRGMTLAGKWKVAAHPHDPKVKPPGHAWIAVTPQRFRGNKTDCQIAVDTGKLLAGKSYQRQLLLEVNGGLESHKITVKVKTPPLLTARTELPYGWLLLLAVLGVNTMWTWGANLVGEMLAQLGRMYFGVLLVLVLWVGMAAYKAIDLEPAAAKIGAKTGAIAGVLTTVELFLLLNGDISLWWEQGMVTAVLGGILGAVAAALTETWTWNLTINGALLKGKQLAGVLAGVLAGFGPVASHLDWVPLGLGFAVWYGVVVGFAALAGLVVSLVSAKGFGEHEAIGISLATAVAGLCVGIFPQVGWHSLAIWPLLGLLVTVVPLGYIMYETQARSAIVTRYRQRQPNLIKP